MEDVAPILLQKIESDFRKQYENDSEIKELLEQLKNGIAKHAEAYSYAGKVGGILADSYADNLSSAVLPEGKMWYNIGSRVIIPTMEENYKYISDYVSEVQEKLNQAAGIGIKPIVPPENKDRVKGIIDRLSSEDDFDKVAWILSDPVKTLARSIVDDSIKANAEFHCKSGMQPKIIRKSSGKCCEKCNELAGTYYYPDVPDDVYMRHKNCDCVVEYDPGNGKRQNVHTKQWKSEEEHDKIRLRKTFGFSEEILDPKVREQNITDIESIAELKRLIKNGEISISINPEKQAPHMIDTRIPGKSYFDVVDIDGLQQILNKYHTTGKIYIKSNGQIKENIELENDIGIHVDVDSGVETKTNRATVHYSKKRTHMVPARRLKENE